MKRLLLLLMGVATLSMGSTPAPFAFECSVLDRVSDAAKLGKAAPALAFEVLRRVAEDRMGDAAPETERLVGLKPGQLRGPEFRDATVRARALYDIGGIDAPEALSYLQALKRADLPEDHTNQVWPAAQIALRQALMNRIADESEKIRFLEDTLAEKRDALSDAGVVFWATGQLCNRGSQESLPLIQEAILKRDPTERGAESYAFCKARADLLSRNPDRATALASVLDLSMGFPDAELIQWAIDQLASMKSPRANAQLERYANQIDALPDDSPVKDAGRLFLQQIRGLLGPPPEKDKCDTERYYY